MSFFAVFLSIFFFIPLSSQADIEEAFKTNPPPPAIPSASPAVSSAPSVGSPGYTCQIDKEYLDHLHNVLLNKESPNSIRSRKII